MVRKIVINILVLALFLAVVTPTVNAVSIESLELASLLEQVILEQLDELGIPGAIVSVVSGEEIILSKGYGYGDLANNSAIIPDETIFRIGSVSKLVTWTAVMQLIEQGMLDLNADVNSYLDFEIPDTKQFGTITLTHLLTHTAGFEDVKDNLFFLDYDLTPDLDDFIKNNIPLRIFPAGEVVAYSNYGTALAGYIVERVSRMSFHDYVEQNIFGPLGMENSTFRQPLPTELAPNLARASRYVNGQFVEDSFVYVSIASAGTMSTTATDMAKFMAAHLNGGIYNGQRILAQETVRMMHSQQFTHHPSLDGMAFGFVEKTFNGERVLFHGGDIFSFQSGLYLLPEHNIGLFVSYSGGNYNQPLDLFEAFMNHLAPYNQNIPQQADGAASRSKAFTGEYHPTRRNVSTDESLLTLLEAIQIGVDSQGFLTANYLGETNRFVEIEPGVYRTIREGRGPSPFGAFNTLVFDTDSNGRTMMFTDGKVAYSQAPWYSTSVLTILAIALTLLFSLVTLVSRAIRLVIRLIKKSKINQSKGASIARWASTGFGLMTVLFLVITLSSSANIHPIFGLPMTIFGVEPALAKLTSYLPIFMLIFAASMVPFVAITWWKGYWTRFARIHYTVFTILAVTLMGVFSHWNLLF